MEERQSSFEQTAKKSSMMGKPQSLVQSGQIVDVVVAAADVVAVGAAADVVVAVVVDGDDERDCSHSFGAGCVTEKLARRTSGAGRHWGHRLPLPPYCCGLLHTPGSALSPVHSSTWKQRE